jgi:hypothetical protein
MEAIAMSRNPYAKALRVKPQQIIPDKRPQLNERALAQEIDSACGVCQSPGLCIFEERCMKNFPEEG